MKDGINTFVQHAIAGQGMASEGNISFAESITTFIGSLRSEGAKAYMESMNATVAFSSSAGSVCGPSLESLNVADDKEGMGFGRKRYGALQMCCSTRLPHVTSVDSIPGVHDWSDLHSLCITVIVGLPSIRGGIW